ncbi:hypothetical protein [Lysinibacillus sp. 54212]|uniref:hypothetical protein n=1 Tax=Lysinibacillus sp. 54212 TaxID=3119829 RepID=UPI002FC983AE
MKSNIVRKIKKAPAVAVRFGGLTTTFRFVLRARKELADLLLLCVYGTSTLPYL